MIKKAIVSLLVPALLISTLSGCLFIRLPERKKEPESLTAAPFDFSAAVSDVTAPPETAATEAPSAVQDTPEPDFSSLVRLVEQTDFVWTTLSSLDQSTPADRLIENVLLAYPYLEVGLYAAFPSLPAPIASDTDPQGRFQNEYNIQGTVYSIQAIDRILSVMFGTTAGQSILSDSMYIQDGNLYVLPVDGLGDYGTALKGGWETHERIDGNTYTVTLHETLEDVFAGEQTPLELTFLVQPVSDPVLGDTWRIFSYGQIRA